MSVQVLTDESVALRAALLQALDNATVIQGLLTAIPRGPEVARARTIADDIILETAEALNYGTNNEGK
jgi:hypothetical protein